MTIVKLFEAQAAKSPDAIAVCFGEEHLTYGQLNHRVNQLAHHLQKTGVGKEQMVGLLLERSLEIVIGLLGVLKSGGAYVPLDPDYPAERVAFMLEDTRVPILLTQSHLTGKLSTIQDWEAISQELNLICLDTEWDQVAHESTENPTDGAAAGDLAYTIYTSGSTGLPKGVMNEHRGISNRLMWMLDTLPLTSEDRVLQKTPYSFDVSIWEFFWPLLSGARLIVAKPGGHKDSDYLVNLIVEEEITAIHFVPSMLQVFLLNEGVEKCRSLQRVICSGEALSYDLQKRFFARLDAELFNLYGPTEAAIEVTYWACQRDGELSTVPIGRPLTNTQIHLLDPQLQPVPLGDSGELHIGGVQVARGYLNRPDLTAERFIPDPFSAEPAARLYKSGDLARAMPDGNILYLGRMDHQVKIRGNRVELGEIEATLAQHPGTQEAVVIAFEAAPGDKRLAAYVVPAQEKPDLLIQLRDFLAAKLPEYMIPATFMFLDSLPLTPSGKVNRQALPAPNRVRPNLSESYVAPRNATEETLAKIWAQVIGLDRVGIHDNYLELGGDSILSIQITSRANQAGLRLTPGQLLQHQTIAELAAVAGTGPLVLAEQEAVTGPLPLTPIQMRFFKQNLEALHLWNQTLLLEVGQTLDISSLKKAIGQLLTHHDALRLRFTQHETAWQQVMAAPDETVPFSHVDLSGVPAAEQDAALRSSIAEYQASLDLSEGPLLRAAFVDLGHDATSYLLLVIHPLAVDGVSWRILLEHLGLLYQQISQAKSGQLPPKTTSFKDWAYRLTEYAQSDRLQQESSFWLQMPDTQTGRLPGDALERSKHSSESSDGLVSVVLSEEDTQALLTEVPKAYRTLITDVLLTALVAAFSRRTGEPALQLDLEGHGREEIFNDFDLSYTVGCFSAIYPVVLNLGGNTNPGEMLISVKEQLRQVPNGGLGYSLLRYLSREDSIIQALQAQPQSEVSFHHMGQLDNLVDSTSIFRQPHDFRGPRRSPRRDQQYPLQITSGIIQGQLCVSWAYRHHMYQRSTIEKLAGDFKNALESLITHCKSPTAGRYTPSDFPEANLTQKELDDLLAEIDEL